MGILYRAQNTIDTLYNNLRTKHHNMWELEMFLEFDVFSRHPSELCRIERFSHPKSFIDMVAQSGFRFKYILFLKFSEITNAQSKASGRSLNDFSQACGKHVTKFGQQRYLHHSNSSSNRNNNTINRDWSTVTSIWHRILFGVLAIVPQPSSCFVMGHGAHIERMSKPHGILTRWKQSLRLYDVQQDSQKQKAKFDHKAAVLDCAFSDGSHAFSGGLDTWVREWVALEHEARMAMHASCPLLLLITPAEDDSLFQIRFGDTNYQPYRTAWWICVPSGIFTFIQCVLCFIFDFTCSNVIVVLRYIGDWFLWSYRPSLGSALSDTLHSQAYTSWASVPNGCRRNESCSRNGRSSIPYLRCTESQGRRAANTTTRKQFEVYDAFIGLYDRRQG